MRTHTINKVIDKILHLFGIYFLKNSEGFGSHRNIKNIYLTRKHYHPLIKDKVKVINIKESWKTLSKHDKDIILNIFNINETKLNFEGKTLMLLTQPLSEGGVMTLDEELNIYKEILRKFEDYKIIIKPHPRDPKNYKKIFPSSTIIDKGFLIEILNLLEIKPTVISGITSTSLLDFKDNSKTYVYDGKLKDERLNKIRRDLIKLLNQCLQYRIDN